MLRFRRRTVRALSCSLPVRQTSIGKHFAGQVRKVVYQLCDAYIDVGGFVLTNADGWTGEEGAGAEGRA